jgi:hypothetical protein
LDLGCILKVKSMRLAEIFEKDVVVKAKLLKRGYQGLALLGSNTCLASMRP